ncbi:Hsp20/alpha crystallin family protein [Halovivax sp.]|uniref:DUF7127 family protein n=1 Tax=Halovivax sp. TaxID=1935978 RepID=UPI0025C252EC|nr:Hsp20/alpha crystallin family protein [Halovivax sp.]
MTLEQLTADQDAVVRHYEYDDGAVVAVDFGPASTDASVDVVDDTAIVVVGERQYDIDLPADAGDAHTFIKNGVLTIDVEANR